MTWPLTFYTNRFIPASAAGCARGPVILIRPEYKSDQGIHTHEKVHALQWLCTLGLHSILYLLIPQYRLWSEVQAYREQAKYYYDDRRPLFAKFIAEDYGLNVTQEKALSLLRK